MAMNEAETRLHLIDPVLREKGYDSMDKLRVEVSTGSRANTGATGSLRKKSGRADYLLLANIDSGPKPMPIAVIEAKPESADAMQGMEQAKSYADCQRHEVKYAFSTNGRLYAEYSLIERMQDGPFKFKECFPEHSDLLDRYKRETGIDLHSSEARMLFQQDHTAWTNRYYQDAAIRAAFGKIILQRKKGETCKLLLSLATGSGKTIIATNLLWRLSEAGELGKPALYLCDRDELRQQAYDKFHEVFGDNVRIVEGNDKRNSAKNARVHIATYQTLLSKDSEAGVSFLERHYEDNAFSVIMIDECHRSAWGEWSDILERNQKAIQIGLTATPRMLPHHDNMDPEDIEITADNIRYFGDPVYEYSLTQAQEDGNLAECEVIKCNVDIGRDSIPGSEVIENGWNIVTGEKIVDAEEVKDKYGDVDFENNLFIVERVSEMCRDLFERLCEDGGPEKKVIVFCTREMHVDRVVQSMNNIYNEWCNKNHKTPKDEYAFKCMGGPNKGADKIADLRSSNERAFIACTVDLLEAGVDIERLNAVVFFRYVQSPIRFYQMVGRGARIHQETEKYTFRVYDYTNATDLFGSELISRAKEVSIGERNERTSPVIEMDGVDVNIFEEDRRYLISLNGVDTLVEVEEYLKEIAKRIRQKARTRSQFKSIWIQPSMRREFVESLVEDKFVMDDLQKITRMTKFDQYDVVGKHVYGLDALTRAEREKRYIQHNKEWFLGMNERASLVLKGLGRQFKSGGIAALEELDVWEVPEIKAAGGLNALNEVGKPVDVIREAKKRLLAA